jgi:hypothetical protein
MNLSQKAQIHRDSHLHSSVLAPGAHLSWRPVPGSVRQCRCVLRENNITFSVLDTLF